MLPPRNRYLAVTIYYSRLVVSRREFAGERSRGPDSLDSAGSVDSLVSCRHHLNGIKYCEAHHFRELPQLLHTARVTISISEVSVR